MPAFFRVVLSRVGRDLAMGQCPVQRVLPKCLKRFIVPGVNYESEQAREPNENISSFLIFHK
jgi:hypothetical protein